MSARVLLYDVECSPLTVHTWGLRDLNVGLSQIRQLPRIIGFGAKFLGDKTVKFYGENNGTRSEMIAKAHELFDEADILVGYNSQGFDTPWFNGEFAKEGLLPPSPFKQIDLYRVARKNFRLPSYKLAHVSAHLGVGAKLETGGHQLWVDCLEGDEETKRRAWLKMSRYCRQDVALLEPLFYKLQPWFPGSVNMALYDGTEVGCQKCGSENLQARGTAYTATRAYPQYRCNDCGGWTRDNKSSWGINSTGVAR